MSSVDCIDCKGNAQLYMVYDDVWESAGLSTWDGWVCVGCLEKRLGPTHPLSGHDFNPFTPANYPPGYLHDTPKSRQLKQEARDIALARLRDTYPEADEDIFPFISNILYEMGMTVDNTHAPSFPVCVDE